MSKLEEYALSIDGPLLASQRRLLNNILDAVSRGKSFLVEGPDHAEHLQGIAELLDEIADQAYDRHGLDSLIEPEPDEIEEAQTPGPHN